MASVDDVAAYILQKMGPITAMKLQKLVYYSQAWSLVWDEKPLFSARIEAWANGPVVPKLYSKHRKMFKIRKWDDGDPDNLKKDESETVDAVLSHYGEMQSHHLSALTHVENPWREARRGIPDSERGNTEITKAAMFEYYDSLVEGNE